MNTNSEKTPVLGTGLSGLVGSRIVDLLGDQYTFQNLDKTEGIDILDPEQIDAVIAASPAKSLIHLAAFTDTNAAQKEAGNKDGIVYQVNVEGTRNIAQSCAKHGVHLIHISTTFVFDGTHTEPYRETDLANPIDWYAQTKLWSEEIALETLPSTAVFRINFPYRQDTFPKLDIWHKTSQALEAGKTGPFFDDHFFTLTPIEWFADVIDWALKTKPAGIYHATTDTVYTDYSFAQEVQQALGLSDPLQASSVHAYNKTAERPYAPYLVASNEKLQQAMNS